MMTGERYYTNQRVHVPPWPYPDDLTVDIHSPTTPNGTGNSNDDFSCLQNDAALKALVRYLPSNSNDVVAAGNFDDDYVDVPVDAYSCDNFRMYDFKVRRCTRARSHDWTDCPYAHPGEKARRRDPRKYHYSGTACPDFRKGSCRKGDTCEFAHGVFECWLHPARYRTQPCKDGPNCRRRVCFFAHAPEQLRVLSPRAAESYDGTSLHRCAYEGSCESSSPPSESPPMSPMTSTNSVNSLSRSHGSNSVNGLVASMRQLQLNKVNSMPTYWSTMQMGSPRTGSATMTTTRPGFYSLPVTPTRTVGRPGSCYFDLWDNDLGKEEAPMERVESGRDLRAKMFEKIVKENPLDVEHPDSNPYPTQYDAPNPDVGWVSELVQ